jgi:hypothetical protein
MAEPVKSDAMPTLKEAMDDAHKKASNAGMADKWLLVKSIHVKGDNPIREYIVELGATGG